MTNGMTHFISYRVIPREHRRNRVDVFMLCFKTKFDLVPAAVIPLTGSKMVSRTCSGSGLVISMKSLTDVVAF